MPAAASVYRHSRNNAVITNFIDYIACGNRAMRAERPNYVGLKLHFLRHGETTHSRENLFCGSGTDAELSPAGTEMARSFARAYGTYPFKAVYSSPMVRTLATAAPICEALKLKTVVKEGLKEIAYGEWEGQDVKSVNRQFHRDYVRWGMNPAKYPPTGGEKASEVEERGNRIIQELRTNFPSGDVLIVSHKATIRILLCSLLGMNVGLFRYRLACPVGSVCVVEVGSHGYFLSAMADREHLSKELRGLPGT